MSRIALCGCGEPLVCTMAFTGAEFYCLSCGNHYGWLEPIPAEETPEGLARMNAVKDEWVTLSAGLIGSGAMLRACQTCSDKFEPHIFHASDEEIDADKAARLRIRERVASTPHTADGSRDRDRRVR